MLTVCGSVGLVEPGMTCGYDAIDRMSGACPPPAPSTWNAWIPRPAIAFSVDSTKPASFRLSACRATWRPHSSAARRAVSIAAGCRTPVLVHLVPGRAGQRLLGECLGAHRVALAHQQHVERERVEAPMHCSRCHAPGVTVVALEPSHGPVPPPTIVVMPVASASMSCDGESR